MFRSATTVTALPVPTVGHARRQDHRTWWSTYGLSMVATVVVALIAVSTAPTQFSLALVLLLIIVALAIIRPRLAIYPIVFFTALGDPLTAPWYPFTKNLSSQESILFLSSGISFTPLELCLGALFVGWLFQRAAQRGVPMQKGRLYRPIMVFSLFLIFGLVHGLGSGGNRNAAFWEIRAMLYLPIAYVLLMNLVDRKEQYRRLYTLIMIAVVMNSIIALINFGTLTEARKETLESFIAHGATLPMNAMLVLLAASWLFRDGSRAKRIVLPFALVPVVYVYIISERRAGFIALLGALILLGIFLFWTRPRAFWKVVPVVFLIGAAYTGAFWNNETSAAGFPAQAIKSVIAPDQVSSRNQDSDFYRIIEKNDIVATIRSSPVLGIGFGHPFLRPYPLPEINPFLLEPYMPHNAILYMWMKVGAFGFLSMVYLFGVALLTGSRTVLRLPRNDYAAITFTSVAFVMMYAIFAYVDISWDPQNMLMLALAMAQIASAPRLIGNRGDDATALDEPELAEDLLEPELRRAPLALHRG
jgi:O-antigen ligase